MQAERRLREAMTAPERAQFVRDQLPGGGLFAGVTWRIAPEGFVISSELVLQFEALGSQLLGFYRACNVMYRLNVAGKLPGWVADFLGRGKPWGLCEVLRC